MLAPNTVLSGEFGQYKIKEQLENSVNGIIFLASYDNKDFAIKFSRSNASHVVKRFRNEINFCFNNHHPNIIKIVDYGVYNNGNSERLFYVMPLYDGNLRKEIEKGIAPERIIEIFRQLLAGVEFVHQKSVRHRDIRPENILYDKSTQSAVVADFGMAYYGDGAFDSTIMIKGDSFVEPRFPAPEHGINDIGRSDTFALGLLLNEMFTKSFISGSQYKKISDCDENYGFWDEFVDELISQQSVNGFLSIDEVLNKFSDSFNPKSDKTELKNTENPIPSATQDIK